MSTSVNDLWLKMQGILRSEIDKTCPMRNYVVRSHRPCWVTNDLIEQMKDRDYFYKKAKLTKDEDDWNIAKYLRNTTNYNTRQAKADYISAELESSKNDPKKFWRTIKKAFPIKDKNTGSIINLKKAMTPQYKQVKSRTTSMISL